MLPTPRNLPAELTSFIGRQHEITQIQELLASSRLVTLTGPAGCGKTRLALRVAGSDGRPYQDGVYWVQLAPLTDPNLVPQAVAKVFNAPNQPGRNLLEGIIQTLRDKKLLLVLDNCEHLLHASSQLAEALLTLPGVQILATTREPLGVHGEIRYPVSPLALPPDGRTTTDIGRYDAIQLFVARAQAINPAFVLTAENAPWVSQICRKLDGIPLALELASRRINVLSLEQIAHRLDDRFELLSAAAPAAQSHHHTLRAALEWSYDLLSVEEQKLLQRLSVFSGGCSLATAEIICSGSGIKRHQVLTLLSALVDKSLVNANTLLRGEARYTLLESIRQYGQERLADADELSKVKNRHLQHFVEVAEETRPKLSGPYQQLWLKWLEREYGNLRAALSWSLESGDITSGLRLAIAIYEFWTIRDYAEEALTWIERLLDQAGEDVPPAVRANALAYATFLAGFRGKSSAQATYGRKAADLAARLGDEGQAALAWTRAGEAYVQDRPGPLPSGGSALAWALTAQAYGARAEGDYETELATYKKVIQLHRQSGERYPLGFTLITAGFAAQSLGKLAEARAMVNEGLPILRIEGNPYRTAMSINGSGDLARLEGNYTRAFADYEESIALLREIGAVRDLASSLHNLGYTCLRLGNTERALSLFGESLALQRSQHNTPGMAECLMGFGATAVVCDMPAAGARLLAAAVAIAGERVATTWPATKLEYEHYLTRIHAVLSPRELEVEQASGQTLSLEQAIEFAQNLPLETHAQALAAVQKEPHSLDALTPREREVAALVAQAKSNAEIAAELVLSKRTVETHISNIRAKLGFTQRAQIVRWAVEQGLTDI